MKEAFRLLNKSIIRVETPDIDFEEGEEELVNGEGGGGEWRVGSGREEWWREWCRVGRLWGKYY